MSKLIASAAFAVIVAQGFSVLALWLRLRWRVREEEATASTSSRLCVPFRREA